jgi:2-polyprenyl-3-methyl-5-hydroxy-6-metoxy-1,4-benzoquinol methylase
MKPNFGATAQDYARYRAGFPDSLFDRLVKHGIGLAGQNILDLGTGTGSLARGFARRGCQVIGLDPAEPLLAMAQEIDRAEGVQVEYRIGRAHDRPLMAG